MRTPHRTVLGSSLAVAPIGIGTMGLSPGVYGDVDPSDAIALLGAALDGGANLVDTADAYGGGDNERLVGAALAGRREDAALATKFGYVGPEHGRRIDCGYRMKLFVDGSPSHVGAAIDASLGRLGTDHVDLWYLHFPDPGIAIEETVGAMAEQVRAGKVRHLGLSNVTAEQLRRAAAVHPIAAVQREYSLWNRSVETELLPACRQVGAGLVAWGPLGSGFLAGQGFLSGSVTEVSKEDFRSRNPRFAPENLAVNVDRFAPLADLAARRDCGTAELALAWLIAKGAVPIPGTRRKDHLLRNLAAVSLNLTEAELAELDARFPAGTAVGATFQ
jgi:aryl-alcohol dehydrogenase-like predicted oxidoreductase